MPLFLFALVIVADLFLMSDDFLWWSGFVTQSVLVLDLIRLVGREKELRLMLIN